MPRMPMRIVQIWRMLITITPSTTEAVKPRCPSDSAEKTAPSACMPSTIHGNRPAMPTSAVATRTAREPKRSAIRSG